MTVYFLRHAEAEPDSGNDAKRKLTPKGLEQADKVGRFMLRLGLIPEAIITSPLVRARQTAKNVAKILGQAGMVEAPWLSSGMSVGICLEELRAYSKMESVVLVGHEPDFSDVIVSLLGGTRVGSIHVRKASLTAIDLRKFQPGGGRLQFLVPARLM